MEEKPNRQEVILHLLKGTNQRVSTRTRDLGHGRSAVRLVANTQFLLRRCVLCNDATNRLPYTFIIGYDTALCPNCAKHFELPVYAAYSAYIGCTTENAGSYDHHRKVNRWYCVVDREKYNADAMREAVHMLCKMCFEQGGRLLYYMRLFGEDPLYGLCVEDLGSGNPLLEASAGKTERELARQGQDISGATDDSYTIAATGAVDHGNTFRCIVDNGTGTPDTSNEATLTLSFIVQVGASLHADVSPARDTVEYGKNTAVFTITPHSGWTFSSVAENGNSINQTSFTIDSVKSNIAFDVKCGKWRTVGTEGFTGTQVTHHDFGLMDETPYYLYRDWFFDNKWGVMKFNGTAWENVGDIAADGFDAIRLDQLVVIDQTIYAYGKDADVGYDATTIKWNGNNWQMLGSRGFIKNTYCGSRVMTKWQKRPAITYFNDPETYFKIDLFQGSSWSTWDSVPSSQCLSNAKMAFDTAQWRPFIAHNDNSSEEKLRVARVANEQLADMGVVSDGKTYPFDLQLHNDTLFLAYSDFLSLTPHLKVHDGTNWSEITLPDQKMYDPKLRWFNNELYLAYDDNDNSGFSVYVLRDGNWQLLGTHGNGLVEYIDGLCFEISESGTSFVSVHMANVNTPTVMKYVIE